MLDFVISRLTLCAAYHRYGAPLCEPILLKIDFRAKTKKNLEHIPGKGHNNKMSMKLAQNRQISPFATCNLQPATNYIIYTYITMSTI